MTRDELETQLKAAHVAAILIHGNDKPFTIHVSSCIYQEYVRMLNEDARLGGQHEGKHYDFQCLMWRGILVEPDLKQEAPIEFVTTGEIDHHSMHALLKGVYLPAIRESLKESSVLWKLESKESHE